MNRQDPKIKSFLQKISQIESSGGRNTNHPLIKSGLQSGQQAIGQFGLLPNTIEEIVNRNRMEGRPSPEIAALEGLPQTEFSKIVGSDPNLENAIASKLAEHVISKQEGNLDKAAYAWNMGHNLPSSSISDLELQKSPYASKFRKLGSIMGGADRNPDSVASHGLQEIPEGQIRMQNVPGGEINTFGQQSPDQLGRLNLPTGEDYQTDQSENPIISDQMKKIYQNRKDAAIGNVADLDNVEKMWQFIKSFRDKPEQASNQNLMRYKFFDENGNLKKK